MIHTHRDVTGYTVSRAPRLPSGQPVGADATTGHPRGHPYPADKELENVVLALHVLTYRTPWRVVQ